MRQGDQRHVRRRREQKEISLIGGASWARGGHQRRENIFFPPPEKAQTKTGEGRVMNLEREGDSSGVLVENVQAEEESQDMYMGSGGATPPLSLRTLHRKRDTLNPHHHLTAVNAARRSHSRQLGRCDRRHHLPFDFHTPCLTTVSQEETFPLRSCCVGFPAPRAWRTSFHHCPVTFELLSSTPRGA